MSSPHQQDSVLARYVQRFRYGEPRSRAERRPVPPAAGEEEARLFWWMNPSSPPSSPTLPDAGYPDDTAALKEDQDPGRRGELRTSRPHREPPDISTLDTSGSSLGAGLAPEGLQERAHRLLQRSESSVSSGSVVISSEGLGDSDSPPPVSVNEPVPRHFFPWPMESTLCIPSSSPPTAGPSQKSYGPSARVSHRPEEDILFQWRLRRKMEQASRWPLTLTLSQQGPGLHQPPPALQGPGLHQPPPALQGPGLHQPPPALQGPGLHQPPPALQGPGLLQPPPAWQGPGLLQPPPAWQGPGLHQPPPALQGPGLLQPPPAWQGPGLLQPPPAWQGPGLHQPPPAWQGPGLLQPPPAWQGPGLHQPPPAWQGPGLHQPLQQQNQCPEPSQTTAQLRSTETRGPCPPAAGPALTSTPHPASSPHPAANQPAREPLLWAGCSGPLRSSPTTQPRAPGGPPAHIAPKPSPPIGAGTEGSPAQGVGEPESCPPTARPKHKRCSRRAAGDGPGPRPRPGRMAASTPPRLAHDKEPRQRDRRPAASAPPPPPVHQALRQAVSEVLFPTRAASTSSVTPRCAPPTPPWPQPPDGSGQPPGGSGQPPGGSGQPPDGSGQPPGGSGQPPDGSSQPPGGSGQPPDGSGQPPDGSGQPPEEVLSQLLRDAEDSDGEEFGDDSLLQVLRKQRTRVRDQISQVDSLLEEFTPDREEA